MFNQKVLWQAATNIGVERFIIAKHNYAALFSI